MEGRLWHDYMDSTEGPIDIGLKGPSFKGFGLKDDAGHHDEDPDEVESSNAEEDDNMSDDLSSSDSDFEIVEYENELTSRLWLPNEPKLYAIFNGRKFVNFNDELDLTNLRDEDSDPGSEDEEEVFTISNPRIHSEYMTMKAINNFT